MFFTDVLETADKTLGYNPCDEPGDDPSRAWSFKLKAEPK
jgi:hypothetical protein